MKAIIGIFILIQIVNVFSRNFMETESYKKTFKAGFVCGQKMGDRILGIKIPKTLQKLPEDDPIFNELYACTWREMNLIDQNSLPIEEEIINYFDDVVSIYDKIRLTTRAHIVDIIHFCITLKGADIGYTAIKIQNCFNEQYSARELLAQLLGFINKRLDNRKI
ncbi:hypothetical protein FQA39_LY11737 [Lamprigera yunnana]|nr:hypothetical protein FQA39_LY11737 [Lamprigera yunnana]